MLLKMNPSNNKGFTLIEILVTLLIMGIIAAIAAPSFMTWANNRKIQQVATDIEGALKEAQSTAVRKSVACNATVTSSAITAIRVGTTENCLPSGTRQLYGSNSNLAISGTGGTTTTVNFSSLGSVTSTQAFVIYRTDVATTIGTKRCIVISAGIGTTRSGTYTGTLPLTLSATPTAAEITTISNACVT
jgi:prepilin-type N-terminal cleavage/methylation domain-containing protein